MFDWLKKKKVESPVVDLDQDMEEPKIDEEETSEEIKEEELTVVDSKEKLEEIGISVVRNVSYKGKYLLNAFTNDEGLYFPDVLTIDGHSQIIYHLIPIDLIRDCANKNKEIVEIIKTGVDEDEESEVESR